MPKKKRSETQAEQSARFQAEIERMIEAGELSPTEAEERLNRLVLGSKVEKEAKHD